MRAWARVRLPDDSTAVLGHGDLVGRLDTAAVSIDDARVSEAHALVSLRGASLKLLALRRRLRVRGRVLTEVELAPGLEVELAPDLGLVVVDVVLPDQLLALEGNGLARQVLTGVSSLHTGPPPRLVGGFDAEAEAVLWALEDRWRVRPRGEQARSLRAGEHFVLGGHTFRAVAVDREGRAEQRTRDDRALGLTITARYDTVHIQPTGQEVVVITGKAARLISELVLSEAPMGWEALTVELWPAQDDPRKRRNSLDVLLARLRARLRGSGIRQDLVRADGTGLIELVRYEDDRLVDRT